MLIADINLDVINKQINSKSCNKIFVLSRKDGNYKIVKYPIGCTTLEKVIYKTHNSWICSTQNPNYKMMIRVCWKNTTGIKMPCFKCVLKKGSYRPREKSIIMSYI